MAIHTSQTLLKALEATMRGRFNPNGLAYDTTIPGTLIDAILAKLESEKP